MSSEETGRPPRYGERQLARTLARLETRGMSNDKPGSAVGGLAALNRRLQATAAAVEQAGGREWVACSAGVIRRCFEVRPDTTELIRDLEYLRAAGILETLSGPEGEVLWRLR
jgi:hypothetical protein